MAQSKPVILLDYDTNDDIENPTKPLSHASLIKKIYTGEQMKEILRMLLVIGLILIAIVIFNIFSITPLKLLILFGIGLVIAFIIAGIQLFFDRKNLAKLEEFEEKK